MLRFRYDEPADRPLRVLCLGAHSDDLEIGCGGTIRKLISTAREVDFQWTVFSGDGERRDEAQTSADAFLAGSARQTVEIHSFRESFFPSAWVEIKEVFEGLKAFGPDLVLTHHTQDAHQDHRTIAELTWNTFRSHAVLEYEIAKYDADLGRPNVFVDLERETAEFKVRTIVEQFASQRERAWFDDEMFWSMLRLRGLESGASSRYAEAFHCRKLLV